MVMIMAIGHDNGHDYCHGLSSGHENDHDNGLDHWKGCVSCHGHYQENSRNCLRLCQSQFSVTIMSFKIAVFHNSNHDLSGHDFFFVVKIVLSYGIHGKCHDNFHGNCHDDCHDNLKVTTFEMTILS